RGQDDHVPGPQAAAYYSQRGSTPGTLLITEATFISQNAGGLDNVPGIYTEAHVEGWKKITDAVHEKGSFIYLQLWALGRAAEPAVLAKENNSPYVSASPIPLPGRPEGEVPRALTTDEIKEYIPAYVTAAKNAIRAGFDGVEVHGANGYLIDQFIQDVSNNRTDEYGGSIENRARFALEVVDAVVEAVGAERTGFRLSPWNLYQGMGMTDPKPQFSYVVEQLRKHQLAYLHIVEPSTSEHNSDFLRDIWAANEGSTFMSNNGHDRKSAIETADNKGGLVSFGRLFMPNPDLPFRLLKDIALAKGDYATWYVSGDLTPTGYSDWPFARENDQQQTSKF
ncbi:FMN-linked oxidoreductase, partial [Rhizopogon salebrosus TDB-379]